MLHKFDEVCQRNNIRYFAYGGTLLGAIRHHGYIPWDDDLDLGIPREDYEKLMRVSPEEWGEELELVSPSEADVKHDKIFPRVYLKQSHIQSYRDVCDWKDPATNQPWHTALMIDLYIFDTIPDDDAEYSEIKRAVLQAKGRYKAAKLKRKLRKPIEKGFATSVRKSMYGSFLRKIDREPWKKLYEESLDRIKSGSKGKRIGSYYSSRKRMYFNRDDVFPLSETAFEDMLIPIPKNYADFLTVLYGETYMQFPPEKDRFHINFIYADLTGGKIFNIDPIPGSLGEKYLSTRKTDQ